MPPSTMRCSAVALALIPVVTLALPTSLDAQDGGAYEVTFHKDITPILQQSCQRCHRANGVAPMSLVKYDDVREFGRQIRRRTSIRDRMGTMPPWYVEKNVGIQHFKDDPSLSDEQFAAIAAWVGNGMPEGNLADAPEPLVFKDAVGWTLGEPDLVVRTQTFTVKSDAPDWWGDIKPVPTGLTEDRYVASVEIREINNVKDAKDRDRETVGGLYVFHHMVWSTRVLDNPDIRSVTWPVHEVGRNPDIFDPNGGRILRAGSSVVSNSTHLHSNGSDTEGHLEIGFRFHPVGYEPDYRPIFLGLGNGADIDIKAGETGQELHAYTVLQQHTKIVTFEPHLHAPGYRMCLEAIWGFNVETLSCVGYDHNWVRGYTFEDDYQPLLPKGTVLHITGYMDNTARNRNVADARNWQGAGNRSVANMFIDLGMQLALTEEQFHEAMAERRKNLNLNVNDHVIGCPLCMLIPERP